MGESVLLAHSKHIHYRNNRRKIEMIRKHENILKATSKRKMAATIFALILTLSMAVPMIMLTNFATAQSTSASLSIDTYALLSVAPNPVGVGQKLSVVMWLDKPPPVPAVQTSTIRAIPYTNLTLVVTKPDNTVVKLGPFTTDSTGSAATGYTPDTTGNYTFQLVYGGEWLTGQRVQGAAVTTDYYKPSVSHIVKLSVQSDPIYALSGAPLPTEYWTRPINAQNYEWNILNGVWLGLPLQFGNGANANGAFNPYGQAPNSAHILWSIPVCLGGIVGGQFTDSDYYTGLSYQSKWNPPGQAVIDGRLYYQVAVGPTATVTGISCVDLATGKEIWYLNNTVLSFAQILQVENLNVHGVHAFLWDYRSGNSTMYDAYSGRALLKVLNCQSATKVAMSPAGDILVYTLNANANWMTLWNSTKATNKNNDLTWSPSITATYNWTDGLMWNVSIPKISGQTWTVYGDNTIITTAAFREATPPVRTLAGYDATTGANLWIMNISDYTIRPQYNLTPIANGTFAWFKQETTQWYGYNARTGQQIWGPTEPYSDDFGMYSASFAGAGVPNPQVAYGNIFTAGYDGVVHAIDLATGKSVWNFNTETTIDTAYGHFPFYGGVTIADNKVFAATNEHTPNDPLARGYKVYCINATDGTPIWNISSWATGPVVADGCLLELNNYDGKLYNFAKGTSAVTVEAPMTSATMGSTVTIRGSVIDTSPGTQQSEQTLRFPQGVPAVSDQSMTKWMEYVYMQQAKPTDTIGVEITLSVVDGNGNYRQIGTTTTSDGFFSYNWKPDITGPYTVYASFSGSESYWPSHAMTAFYVDPTAPTQAPQQTQGPSMADQYLLPGIAAIIVVIVIIGAVLALLVTRKRS
jgi:outer membrane protein assembly factor BamB